MSIPKQITVQQLNLLRTAFYQTSHRFASYNFREYFLRRTRIKFQRDLPLLLHSSSPSSSSIGQASEERQVQEEEDLMSLQLNDDVQERLKGWWKEAVEELRVLDRASMMNRMFEGPKLVVEEGFINRSEAEDANIDQEHARLVGMNRTEEGDDLEEMENSQTRETQQGDQTKQAD